MTVVAVMLSGFVLSNSGDGAAGVSALTIDASGANAGGESLESVPPPPPPTPRTAAENSPHTLSNVERDALRRQRRKDRKKLKVKTAKAKAAASESRSSPLESEGSETFGEDDAKVKAADARNTIATAQAAARYQAVTEQSASSNGHGHKTEEGGERGSPPPPPPPPPPQPTDDIAPKQHSATKSTRELSNENDVQVELRRLQIESIDKAARDDIDGELRRLQIEAAAATAAATEDGGGTQSQMHVPLDAMSSNSSDNLGDLDVEDSPRRQQSVHTGTGFEGNVAQVGDSTIRVNLAPIESQHRPQEVTTGDDPINAALAQQLPQISDVVVEDHRLSGTNHEGKTEGSEAHSEQDDAAVHAKAVEPKLAAKAEPQTHVEKTASTERAQSETKAEEERLAHEAEVERLHELVAQAEAERLAQEADNDRLAQEAEEERLAQEVESQRLIQLATNAEAERIAQETETKRIAQAAEAERQVHANEAQKLLTQQIEEEERRAQEAEAKRVAQDAEAKRQAQAEEAQKLLAREVEEERRAQEAQVKKLAREAKAAQNLEAETIAEFTATAELERQAQAAEAERLLAETNIEHDEQVQLLQKTAAPLSNTQRDAHELHSHGTDHLGHRAEQANEDGSELEALRRVIAAVALELPSEDDDADLQQQQHASIRRKAGESQYHKQAKRSLQRQEEMSKVRASQTYDVQSSTAGSNATEVDASNSTPKPQQRARSRHDTAPSGTQEGPKASREVQAQLLQETLRAQQVEKKSLGLGWIERLKADGEIYYVNVRTREETRDINQALDQSHLPLAEQRRQDKMKMISKARARAAQQKKREKKRRSRAQKKIRHHEL